MEAGFTIEQPPNGFVRYIDHLGTDQRIVEAARVSYRGASKGESADRKLLEYLFSHRHTSPFEQCNITFNIRFPIFLMRQFVRHRTFRLNEWSGRYSELPNAFYLPKAWRKPNPLNKQGSIEDPDWDVPNESKLSKNERLNEHVQRVYEEAHRVYELLLAEGVAKEMSRFVLPVGIYTEIYVNCDLHNLTHFLRLRLAPGAQQEIRLVAIAMFQIAKSLFPWTMEAFNRYKMEIKDSAEPA